MVERNLEAIIEKVGNEKKKIFGSSEFLIFGHLGIKKARSVDLAFVVWRWRNAFRTFDWKFSSNVLEKFHIFSLDSPFWTTS
jgi:hypothetical protein